MTPYCRDVDAGPPNPRPLGRDFVDDALRALHDRASSECSVSIRPCETTKVRSMQLATCELPEGLRMHFQKCSKCVSQAPLCTTCFREPRVEVRFWNTLGALSSEPTLWGPHYAQNFMNSPNMFAPTQHLEVIQSCPIYAGVFTY